MAHETVRTVDVVKEYRLGRDNIVYALRGINIVVERGQYVSIMGPSGSGKSTLFNMVGGLDKPTRGKVYIDGVDISELAELELAWLRCHKIGYIFQTFNLIDVMSALQNVTLPMIFQGASAEEAQERGTRILNRVGLGHRLHHKPFELSGGQQQRVAIARALSNTPTVILADEPTGNLDTRTGTEIVHLLKELNQEEGVTVVCSTHDYKMITTSDRVCWIRDGRLEKISTGEEFRLEEMAADDLGRA